MKRRSDSLKLECELYLFSVSTAELADDDLRELRIRIFDFYGVLQFLFIKPHKISLLSLCLRRSVRVGFPRPWTAGPVPRITTCIREARHRHTALFRKLAEKRVTLGEELVIVVERLSAVGVSVEIEHGVHDREIKGTQARKKRLARRRGNGRRWIAAAVATAVTSVLRGQRGGEICRHTASSFVAFVSVVSVNHGKLLLSMVIRCLPRSRRGRGGRGRGRSCLALRQSRGRKGCKSLAGARRPFPRDGCEVPNLPSVRRERGAYRSAEGRASVARLRRAYGGASRLRCDLLGFGCRHPYTLLSSTFLNLRGEAMPLLAVYVFSTKRGTRAGACDPGDQQAPISPKSLAFFLTFAKKSDIIR